MSSDNPFVGIGGSNSGGNSLEQSIRNLNKKRIADFSKQVKEDKTIDEQTRNELLSSFSGVDVANKNQTFVANNIKKVGAEFKLAKEGTLPKYKARQQVQQLYNMMVDQPGQRQTKGPDFSLLMGNAFKGRGK